MSIHNAQIVKGFRKDLRNDLTEQERILWSQLKNSQQGYKFRRQHSVGPYILDFFCPERLLAIELDGSQHLDNKEYDEERTNYLASLNITVLRFWNNEIRENLAGVMMTIREALERSEIRYYSKEEV